MENSDTLDRSLRLPALRKLDTLTLASMFVLGGGMILASGLGLSPLARLPGPVVAVLAFVAMASLLLGESYISGWVILWQAKRLVRSLPGGLQPEAYLALLSHEHGALE